MSKKDYQFSILAGLLMGLLTLPVLKALEPSLFARLAPATLPLFLVMTPLGLAIAYSLSRRVPVMWQAGKFAVIGALNVLVDWGVLSSLIFLFRRYFEIDSKDLIIAGITFYSAYKAVSFVVANINSYYWNKYWTFGARAEKTKRKEFLQFFVVSALGFLINVFIASYVFKSMRPARGLTMDQWGIIGAAAGSIAGLFWNFLGYKFLVFKAR